MAIDDTQDQPTSIQPKPAVADYMEPIEVKPVDLQQSIETLPPHQKGMFDYISERLKTETPLGVLESLKKHVVDPAIGVAQVAQNVAAGPALSMLPPVAEYAARQFSLPLGELNGPGSPNQMGGERLAKGRQQYESVAKRAIEQAAVAGASVQAGQDLEPLGEISPLQAGNIATGASHVLQSLPLFAIPGIEGAGLPLELATQGAVIEMATPGGSPTEGFVGGAALGAAGSAARAVAKGVGEGIQALRKPAIPIAAVPEDGVQDLARSLKELPERVTTPPPELAPTVITEPKPSQGTAPGGPRARQQLGAKEQPVTVPGRNRLPPPTAHVVDSQGGQAIVQAVTANTAGEVTKAIPGRIKAMPPAEIAKVAKQAEVVPTAEALADPEIGDGTWEALNKPEDIERIRKELVGAKITPVDLTSLKYPDAPGDVLQDGIVVIAGDDGALGIHKIKGEKFQKQSLTHRNLVEVTLPSGEKRLAFWDGIRMRAPEPEERIPGALEADIPLQDGKAPAGYKQRLVTDDRKLSNIVLESELARARAEQDALLAQVPEPSGPLPSLQPVDPVNPPNGWIPPHVVQQNDAIDRWLKALPPSVQAAMVNTKNVGKKVSGFLVHSSITGPKDAAQFALTQITLKQNAMRTIENDTIKSVFGPQLQALPKEKQAEFFADLNTMLNNQGTASAKYIDQKWGPIAQWNAKFMEDTKLAIDARDQLARDLGGLPDINDTELHKMLAGTPEQRKAAEEFMRDYAVTSYNRFLLPKGEWAKIAKRDEATVTKWKAWLEQRLVEHSDDWKHAPQAARDSMVELTLNDILGASDARTAPAQMEGLGGSWLNSLKARKEIPLMVQEMLGKTNHGLVRLAQTVHRQNAVIANLTMWKELMDTAIPLGKFVPKDTVGHLQTTLGEDFIRLPDSPAIFGKAAGGYIDPDWYRSVVEAPRQIMGAQNAAMRIMQTANRIVKAPQTVYNFPGSWVNQVLGNVSGILASGSNFAPWTVSRHIIGMRGDFLAYGQEVAKLGAGAGSVQANRILRAKELFGSFGTYNAAELQSANRLIEQILREKPDADFVDIARAIPEKLGKIHGKIGHLYSLPDEIAKYASWTGLMEKAGIDLNTGKVKDAKKAAAFLGVDLLPFAKNGEMERQIEREAARRVWLSFPMLDRVAPAGKALQQVGIFGGSPYAGIKMEMVRTWGHIPGRILSEPGYKAHMLKVAAVTSALAGAWKGMSALNGISQAEVDKQWALEPKNTQWLKPAATAAFFRDSEGRIQFVDLNNLTEFMQYMQGNPDTPAYQRIAANALRFPFEGGLLEKPSTDIINMMFGPTLQTSPQFDTPEYMDKRAAFADKVLNTLAPGLTRGARILANTAGVQSPIDAAQRPHFTPGQAAAGLLGAKIQPASSEAIKGQERLKEFNQQNTTLKKSMNPMHQGQYRGLFQGSGNLSEDAARAAEQLRNQKEKK